MSIVSKAKEIADSDVSNTKDAIEKVKDFAKDENIDKAGESLLMSLVKVSDMGINGVDEFLETAEGKKVQMEIIKYYAKKYWWALTAIGIFDVIGIFAATKFVASNK